VNRSSKKMVNYPTRCACFLILAIVFFLLPSIGLIYFYNLPLIQSHSLYNESVCATLPVNYCPFLNSTEDTFLCVSFLLGASGNLSSGALYPLRRDRPLKVDSRVKCFYDPVDVTVSLNCVYNSNQKCCPPDLPTRDTNDCVGTAQPNGTNYIVPNRAGCVFVNPWDGTHHAYLNASENLNITGYGLTCYSTNQTLHERLEYGGLTILLEGFFLTFAAILFIGVGLSTFVEKSENNDAYCFSIKL